MNIQNKYISLGKSLLSGAFCAGVLSASMGVQADVAQAPLNLLEGVSPNMIFTLDDSTSMNMAYAPDNRDGDDSVKPKIPTSRETRRAKSAHFNPIYYNPSVTYKVPPLFDNEGVEHPATYYDKGFIDTPINGYNPSGTKVDLSNNYQVSWSYNTSKGISNCYGCDSSASRNSLLAENPASDFQCNANYSNSSKPTSCTTDAGIKVNISRVNKNTCKANSEFGEFNFSCDDKTKSGSFSWEKRSTPAYYYVYDKNLQGCDNKKDNDACYKLVIVSENSGLVRTDDTKSGRDERQNFSNWYAFYKTRALATLSAASIAFYDLDTNVRFTWQDLIHCKTLDSDKCGGNKFKPYTSGHKQNFYKWLQHLTSFNDANGTPLRSAMTRAGNFLEKKGSVAWLKYPNDSTKAKDNALASNKYACRASYHVMMTDGMWNSDDKFSTTALNHDNKVFTLPDGKTYTGTKNPYSDATEHTLADVAMHYWSKDLSGLYDVNNKKMLPYIPNKNDDKDIEYWDPANNPATWQSMSNFIMGLGLTEALDKTNIPWAGSTHVGIGYKNLSDGTAWPVAKSNDNNNVYDLWHAAINSRGDFYSVDSPEAMVQAFTDILARIADRKASAAMPGNSTSLESDGLEEDSADRLASYFYQSSYDSSNGWTGDIRKVKKYRRYNTTTFKFEDVIEQGWSAKEQLPAHGSRNIMIADSASTDSKLKGFNTANAGLPTTAYSLAYYLNANPDPKNQTQTTWQQRLDYVRGSTANASDNDSSKLRYRSSVLGDFLSSQPAIVSGARYLEGFANRLEDNEAYTAFMQKVEGTSEPAVAGRRGQLYIGGNDGMLHAFDTKTGEEKFAFIPTAVFPKLNKLTGKNYTHEYYVDGTPVIADVYDKDKAAWRTILVGTLRAGGKGLFALDITNPDSIKLLWELDDTNFPEKLSVKPGYSFPQPTVARLHNGEWAVVTGNGYEGAGTTTGKAALYIINAITGTMIKSLEVQSPFKDPKLYSPNGLSSPRLADFDSDGIADYAYAGDLHGNLWRFDLLGTNASGPTLSPPSNGSYGDRNGGDGNFAVSYAKSPMFTATSTKGGSLQPITSAPNLVRHPTRKGYLVIFGTGKYFESVDKEVKNDHAQSLYGIWDMKTKAEATVADTINRTQLAVQTITSETAGMGKVSGKMREARIMSNNAVEWYTGFDSTKPVNKRGWRLDLASGALDGEMIVENMRTLGSMLLVQTLVPGEDPCAQGSGNWLYAINPSTGGRTLHQAFDTRAANDVIVSAIKFGSEGGVSISQSETGFTANAPGDQEPIAPPPDSMGRQSWRMVPDA